jgi:hypothetical protein
MGKASRNIFDSNSDVSDDLSPDDLSLRVVELENAICNQDNLLCRVFRENKKLNLELENSFSETASLQSVHDDTRAKPCDNYNMICGMSILMLLVCLMVPGWNSESSKLVPHWLVLAPVVL